MRDTHSTQGDNHLVGIIVNAGIGIIIIQRLLGTGGGQCRFCQHGVVLQAQVRVCCNTQTTVGYWTEGETVQEREGGGGGGGGGRERERENDRQSIEWFRHRRGEKEPMGEEGGWGV